MVLSASPPEQFFDQVASSIRRFCEEQTPIRRSFVFGSLGSIQCVYGSQNSADRLFRACSHIASEDIADPDITFYFLDEQSAGFNLPELPWDLTQIGVQGVIDDLSTGDLKAVWQFGSDVLYLYHRIEKWGLFWTHDVSKLPHWELSFPLRYPVTWMFEERNALMVHAGAVGTRKGAVLLVGKSGSGKSTTSISALQHGMQFLGDDYVLASTPPSPRVYSLFSAVKASSRTLAELKSDGSTLTQYPLGTTEETEKRVTYLEDYFGRQIVSDLPLIAMIHPVIANQHAPEMTTTTAGKMLKTCAPSTIFQIPCDRPRAFNKLRLISESLPCFEFRLCPDLNRNAAFLEDWIDNITLNIK